MAKRDYRDVRLKKFSAGEITHAQIIRWGTQPLSIKELAKARVGQRAVSGDFSILSSLADPDPDRNLYPESDFKKVLRRIRSDHPISKFLKVKCSFKGIIKYCYLNFSSNLYIKGKKG